VATLAAEQQKCVLKLLQQVQ